MAGVFFFYIVLLYKYCYIYAYLLVAGKEEKFQSHTKVAPSLFGSAPRPVIEEASPFQQPNTIKPLRIVPLLSEYVLSETR